MYSIMLFDDQISIIIEQALVEFRRAETTDLVF